MRREEKEITDKKEIIEIVKRAEILRLAVTVGAFPYIIPLNFGFENNTIYFHSAKEGKKIEMLKKNNNVSFQLSVDTEIIRASKACNWSMKYKSVIGFGKATFIEDFEEKKRGLDIIMGHYSNQSFEYSEKAIDATEVVKININELTGKKA